MERKVLSMLISTTTAVSMFSTFANAEVKDDSVNTTQDKSVVSNESYEISFIFIILLICFFLISKYKIQLYQIK